jgi:hypothetical protein
MANHAPKTQNTTGAKSSRVAPARGPAKPLDARTDATGSTQVPAVRLSERAALREQG